MMGMAFADLKNDFVFRRIFATHPDILRSLLNDLLERSGDRTIEAIEYLPAFTREKLDAYQRALDEIQQVRELAEAKLAEGEAIGIAKGHKAGKIAALVAVLTARGFSVTEEVRARIDACEDEAILDRWITRATTASSLEAVFTAPEASA